MSEMIQIRSIRNYFKEFGIDGIGRGANVELTKQQIIDAFRKEIFGQITFKLRINDISEAQETPANKLIVENILKNSYKKWMGLIREFNKYRETYNILKPDDLDDIFKDLGDTYDPLDGFDDEEEGSDV